MICAFEKLEGANRCVIQQIMLSNFSQNVNEVHLLSKFVNIIQKIFQKRLDIIQIHGIMNR